MLSQRQTATAKELSDKIRAANEAAIAKFDIPRSVLGKPAKKPSKKQAASLFDRWQKKLDKIIVASFEASTGKKLKPHQKRAVLSMMRALASDDPFSSRKH